MRIEVEKETRSDCEEIGERIAELKAIGFEPRIVNALARACHQQGSNYLDPEYLRFVPDEVLLGLKGLGKKSVRRIREILEKRGLSQIGLAEISEMVATLGPGETLVIKRQEESFRVEKFFLSKVSF